MDIHMELDQPVGLDDQYNVDWVHCNQCGLCVEELEESQSSKSNTNTKVLERFRISECMNVLCIKARVHFVLRHQVLLVTTRWRKMKKNRIPKKCVSKDTNNECKCPSGPCKFRKFNDDRIGTKNIIRNPLSMMAPDFSGNLQVLLLLVTNKIPDKKVEDFMETQLEFFNRKFEKWETSRQCEMKNGKKLTADIKKLRTEVHGLKGNYKKVQGIGIVFLATNSISDGVTKTC